MGRWIDISMAVPDGLRTNTSRPGEEVRITYDVKPSDDPPKAKTVRRVSARLHVGTHVDGPEHMVRGAARIDQLPIESFTGRAWVGDMYDKVPRGVITARDVERAVGAKVRPGDSVILRTGWNAHYADADFFTDSPVFDPAAADWFIERAAKIVAVDFLCDPIPKGPGPHHGPDDPFKTRTLGAGVLVLTNADNLDRIAKDPVTLYAFPLKLIPSESGLTRAVVWEE
ncbi:MAG: cyclase family protein [Chloroflexota bacterium]|nr:cyclase family protein [Chloroflexota bacterium]